MIEMKMGIKKIGNSFYKKSLLKGRVVLNKII
jgi:hypothetical protein